MEAHAHNEIIIYVMHVVAKSEFANLFCKDQESMLTSMAKCFSWSFKQGGYWIISIYKSFVIYSFD